jgi:2-keto-4-pentenoate hydratase
MTFVDAELERIARRILDALDQRASIPPIAGSRPDFGLDEAYAVSGRIMRERNARGENTVGWKIGFTNRAIWDEYGVHAPIWGPVYDTTLAMVEAGAGPAICDVGHLVEPRIEPEIAFRLAEAPRPGMEVRQLLGCIDAVAHGVEIVQSVFPGWRFQAADTVAAFALHGLYRCGPPVTLSERGEDDWLRLLADFEIGLFRNGDEIDRGHAGTVLGGPLAALKHFVDGFDHKPFGRGLQPGDWITTGTVTRAFPIRPGETWKTRIEGLPLPGLALEFSA